MTNIRIRFLTAAFLLALGGIQAAAAATITSTLGNPTPGYSDGASPLPFALNQTGPAPVFDRSIGNDVFPGDTFSATWSHGYVAIADPILSASITIGIWDHDSAAEGSQLAQFSVDGFDLTASLDSQFEQPGDGLDGMYNEYTVTLGAAAFADLSDGLAVMSLALLSPGLTTCTLAFLCPDEPVVPAVIGSAGNGAALIFSTLTIETLEISPPAIPIPAAAPLFATALALFGLYRRRVQRKDV